MDTLADRTQAQQAEAEPEKEHIRVHEDRDPNREGPGRQQPPFPSRAGFLKKWWEQKDKQGVQCFNCQKYRHIAKECFQRKKPRTPQPGPLTQARKTYQGEESNNKAKDVMTTPMVSSTWPRVRSTLESDCLPALSQGTASFCLVVD